MITKVVNVNLHQPIYERLTAKQGDIASRYLLFHLLDGDKPFDLSNRTVRVYAIKPDKTEIFNDLTINDASKGYCTLELTSQCLAAAGVVKMELYISESGKVLTSIPFELEVIACINTANSVTSTNEFSALVAALGSLQDFDNLKTEIVDARKTHGTVHGTVGERLDKFDSQLETITNNIDGNFYNKESVNQLVGSKIEIGEARENTNVKPINYREFDTETKTLFTGGSVAVVGVNSVGSENLKDLSVTSNKRTKSMSYCPISIGSSGVITLDVPNKTLNFPSGEYNLIYIGTGFIKIPSDLQVDISGNNYSCSLYYDTVANEFKNFETDTLNDNCVNIGTVWWNNTTGDHINSNFVFDYVIKNGDEISSTVKGNISHSNIYAECRTAEVYSQNPWTIDMTTKQLIIDKTGYCKVFVNGYLRVITDDYVNLDVGGQYVVLLYDLLNKKLKAVNMPDSQITDTKICYYLGTINMTDPAISRVRFRFNINGYNVKQRWYNKKIGCLGDSITFGAGGTSWVTRLKELTGCKEGINYGVSGTCIQENGTGKSFVERYSSMADDLDLICVWGGVNDHHWTGSSGRKFGDINTSTSEINTFYGALKNLCEGLLNKYPTKTIMFITPMKNKGYVSGSTTCPAWNEKNGLEGGVGRTLTDYRNAIIEVCEFYSIPVLDLYALSGISPENEKQVENLMPDRLHPNTKGNLEILAPKIASFMNNL